jgi:hypothetical protein
VTWQSVQPPSCQDMVYHMCFACMFGFMWKRDSSALWAAAKVQRIRATNVLDAPLYHALPLPTPLVLVLA